MDNWTMIRECPTEIEGLTIRGYKCKYCDRPVLASIPDEDKWDTNILTYIYCPHCGQKIDENRTIHIYCYKNRTIHSENRTNLFENRTNRPKIVPLVRKS